MVTTNPTHSPAHAPLSLVLANVPHIGTFPIEIHARDDQFISSAIQRDGIWEPFETEIFRRLCHADDMVVDIGANIGWYTVLATKLVGPLGKVIAIEPDADNRALLNRNVAMAGGGATVDIRSCAVGDAIGDAKFYLSPVNKGDHRLFDGEESRTVVNVPIDTLDNILKDETRTPALIKSDTQGAEAKILRGAKTLLAGPGHPILILEFWPQGLTQNGDDPMALWSQLAAGRYRMFEINDALKQLLPLDQGDIEEQLTHRISVASGRFLNLLCVPEGSAKQINIQDLIAI